MLVIIGSSLDREAFSRFNPDCLLLNNNRLGKEHGLLLQNFYRSVTSSSTRLTFLSRIFCVITFISLETTSLTVAYCLLEAVACQEITKSNDKEVAMGPEETRHDLWLKRINTWIAILGSSVASVAGAYNFLPSFFPPAPGHIAAVVREQGGTPVPRAHVELLSSDNVLLATSETDRNGRFIRKDLEAGSYIVKVSRATFEPQTAKVSIASKKTTDLDLVLRSRPRAQVSNSAQPTTPQPRAISQPEGSAIRSALEETGAAWIKNLSNAGR